MEELRLNKYLSDMGYCSRREADRLIENGDVFVNGVKAVMGMKVSGSDEISVKGKLIGLACETVEIKRVLLAVNKPRGVVVSMAHQGEGRNIADIVDYPERVYPIGRLDKESDGLILMTNRGDLVNRISKASNYHEKEYVVKVNKIITPDFLNNMRKGVFLEELGVRTRKCEVTLIDDYTFNIILTQGLNRQIRRMCETFDYKVTSLTRIRIMNINLGKLNPGTWRIIKGDELKRLEDALSRR